VRADRRYIRRLSERFGGGLVYQPTAPTVWLHAVSVVKWSRGRAVAGLRDRIPTCLMVIGGNVAGRMVAKRVADWQRSVLCPIDYALQCGACCAAFDRARRDSGN